MAVEEFSTTVWVARSVVKNLGLISKANGYRTDVFEAKKSEYMLDRAHLDAMLAESDGTILVQFGNEDTETGTIGGPAVDRCRLRVRIFGLRKRAQDVQESIMDFASDTRRVMRLSNVWEFPGSFAGGAYGIMTIPSSSPTFDYHYFGDDRITAAAFLSDWDVLFNHALTTG